MALLGLTRISKGVSLLLSVEYKRCQGLEGARTERKKAYVLSPRVIFNCTVLAALLH
jgi:hypothetical protein